MFDADIPCVTRVTVIRDLRWEGWVKRGGGGGTGQGGTGQRVGGLGGGTGQGGTGQRVRNAASAGSVDTASEPW